MNFKYKITLQDYIKFNKFNRKNIFSTVIKIWCCVCFIYAILTLNIVLIIIGSIYFAAELYERKLYKTYYYSKKELTEELELKIDKNQITEKTIYTETSLKISEFYKITENKEYYFLYISKYEAIILPKRFVDKKQQEALNEIFSKTKK